MRNLIVLTLLFQLSFGDLIARVFQMLVAPVQETVVIAEPETVTGMLPPPPPKETPEPTTEPCIRLLTFPSGELCPSAPSEGK